MTRKNKTCKSMMRVKDFYSNLIKGYQEYSALIVSLDEIPRIYIKFAFMAAEHQAIWETVSNTFLKKREKSKKLSDCPLKC